MSDEFEQQSLIDFLEKERNKRALEVASFAPLLGLSTQQYYNLRLGKKAGPQLCLDMGRALDINLDYMLFLGGFITEDELHAPKDIPHQLIPVLQKASQMKGTPFFDTLLDQIEHVVDDLLKLFRKAA